VQDQITPDAAIILFQMRDVLEFLCDEKARDLRAGAVLPNEVHVLQFSYGSGGEGAVSAVRGGGVSGDSGA